MAKTIYRDLDKILPNAAPIKPRTPAEERKRQYQNNWNYKHRKNNKEYIKKYNTWRAKRGRELAKILIMYKKTGCIDCGLIDIRCMDMHHRDPTTKTGDIPKLINGAVSNKRFKDELRKCDVLCSNCHRIRHYEEKHKGSK